MIDAAWLDADAPMEDALTQSSLSVIDAAWRDVLDAPMEDALWS